MVNFISLDIITNIKLQSVFIIVPFLIFNFVSNFQCGDIHIKRDCVIQSLCVFLNEDMRTGIKEFQVCIHMLFFKDLIYNSSLYVANISVKLKMCYLFVYLLLNYLIAIYLFWP